MSCMRLWCKYCINTCSKQMWTCSCSPSWEMTTWHHLHYANKLCSVVTVRQNTITWVQYCYKCNHMAFFKVSLFVWRFMCMHIITQSLELTSFVIIRMGIFSLKLSFSLGMSGHHQVFWFWNEWRKTIPLADFCNVQHQIWRAPRSVIFTFEGDH